MATRAVRMTDHATIAAYTVATGQTVTQYQYVSFASADEEIQAAGGATTDTIIGIALRSGVAGDRVSVVHPGPIVPAKASGVVTRGTKVITTTGGEVANASAAAAGGANVQSTYGFAVQSGVDGDLVGICLTFGNRGIA